MVFYLVSAVLKPDLSKELEQDYCIPPLPQERAAALDRFFERLSVAPIQVGEGWNRIRDLPRLFPDLKG